MYSLIRRAGQARKYAGDKSDVTALVKYAQDLETGNERLRAALKVAHTYVPPGEDHQMIVDALLGSDTQKEGYDMTESQYRAMMCLITMGIIINILLHFARW